MIALRGVACVVGLACAGCDPAQSAPPPCSAALPAQAVLLGSPEFATLQFHRRNAFDAAQGSGSDVWADDRFEYRAAVEFGFVPARNPDTGPYCADAVSMKVVLPVDEPRRNMLRAFVRSIAARTTVGPEELWVRVEGLLSQRTKYRPVEMRGNNVSVEAGVLPHPKWGDLFVVAFVAR